MKNYWSVIATVLLVILLLIKVDISAQKSTKIYIVDDKIMNEDSVNRLDQNRIKILKIVSRDDEKLALAKKFGFDENNSLVMTISLYSEEEFRKRPVLTKEQEDSISKKVQQDNVNREKNSTLIHVGDKAPDFSVIMLDGHKIKLSELKGKVVLLNFWATWCGPCMMEFEEIPEQILTRFAGKNLVLLPISRGETKEVVATKMDKLKTKGINFNVGLDPNKSIYKLYATEFIPRNFLIDASGKVVYTSVGYGKQKMTELIQEIEKLLQ